MRNLVSVFALFFAVTLVSGPAMAAQTFYVRSSTGNNRDNGSKETPFKNIQKAIDEAKDGDIIHVAEGNYFGTLDKGNINVTKAVGIIGGWNADFSVRDVLRHRTLVQPTPASNGTASGQGTMAIQVKKPGTEVVIDGIIFDRGNSVAYSAAGEGKPEGVESAMMVPIGSAGVGGANLDVAKVMTKQTALLYLDTPTADVTIRNCTFINAPWHGILGTFSGQRMTVANNVFVNNRMAAVEINGGVPTAFAEVHFTNNTILFVWTRLRDMGDMGYGFRYGTRVNAYVTDNIIGLCALAGLDRGKIDADRNREAQRVTTAERNLFFLNKQGDLTLPGGGKSMRVWADQFGDIEQLAAVEGNKTFADPSVFKGLIDMAYLEGFLSASYGETADFDPNSPVNLFRQAMGMNMRGTTRSTATMFANRYPWEEALKLFGAIERHGAQAIAGE